MCDTLLKSKETNQIGPITPLLANATKNVGFQFSFSSIEIPLLSGQPKERQRESVLFGNRR
jgi:hypothetical protein